MQYWLFKAEPDEFGIEHLAAQPKKTGRWDGIRNYQARNFLRDQVTKGDAVFIYHSHCKQPGVVGIADVIKAAYPDPTQFDPQSPYFDSKATPDLPRWVAVDIKLTRRFDQVIPLSVIKQQTVLENMVLLKQARLSIQPVSEHEWQAILQLANQ